MPTKREPCWSRPCTATMRPGSTNLMLDLGGGSCPHHLLGWLLLGHTLASHLACLTTESITNVACRHQHHDPARVALCLAFLPWVGAGSPWLSASIVLACSLQPRHNLTSARSCELSTDLHFGWSLLSLVLLLGPCPPNVVASSRLVIHQRW